MGFRGLGPVALLGASSTQPTQAGLPPKAWGDFHPCTIPGRAMAARWRQQPSLEPVGPVPYPPTPPPRPPFPSRPFPTPAEDHLCQRVAPHFRPLGGRRPWTGVGRKGKGGKLSGWEGWRGCGWGPGRSGGGGSGGREVGVSAHPGTGPCPRGRAAPRVLCAWAART